MLSFILLPLSIFALSSNLSGAYWQATVLNFVPQPHWWLLIMLWGSYSVVELLRGARTTNPARRIKSLQSIHRNLEQLLMSLRRRSVFFHFGLVSASASSSIEGPSSSWDLRVWNVDRNRDRSSSITASCKNRIMSEWEEALWKKTFGLMPCLFLFELFCCLAYMFGHTVWTFFVASVHFCSRSGFNQQQQQRRRWFGFLASRNNFAKWFLLKELSLSSLTYHLS